MMKRESRVINHAEKAAVAGARLPEIDFLRGVVMVLMTLDHVRDYFSDADFNPTDLTRTTVALFVTRWITHFCAPVFFFLAGVSAYLSLQRGKTASTLAGYLLTRGLGLMLLEVTVIAFGWGFNLQFSVLFLQVIWALGASMVVLSGLVNAPRWLSAGLGVAIIILHNCLDEIRAADFNSFGPLWAMLHSAERVPLSDRLMLVPTYPLLPWAGVMVTGFAFGSLVEQALQNARRQLFGMGVVLVLLFILLRYLNGYGDPQPWSVQSRDIFTLLAFLDTTKYPPSLSYLLMTLGPALLILALAQRVAPRIQRFFLVYGRVPLFFYILHLYLIHFLAVVAGYLGGFPVQAFFTAFPRFPQDYGFGLPVVYCIWFAVVLLLFPLCRRYATIKFSRSESVLAYL